MRVFLSETLEMSPMVKILPGLWEVLGETDETYMIYAKAIAYNAIFDMVMLVGPSPVEIYKDDVAEVIGVEIMPEKLAELVIMGNYAIHEFNDEIVADTPSLVERILNLPGPLLVRRNAPWLFFAEGDYQLLGGKFRLVLLK